MTELRWAWRSIRARGWRACLAAALLAVALAANTLVFSAADSLVFHRAPFRGLDQLVEIQRRDARTGQPSGNAFLSVALLDEWRAQTDLVSAVHGSLTKTIFLAGAGEPELVSAADVTIGLIELLGARPRWGRTLIDGDERRVDVQMVLVSESLARERFGDPAVAVGQTLTTTAEPLSVVGVMPANFRYPGASQRIWRALDPRGPLAAGFAGVSSVARLTPGMSLALATPVIERRSAAIGEAAGAPAGYTAVATPLRAASSPASQRQMFVALLSAAACLLLLACANVASLELASAITRARTYAIQLAVGASRASLVRTGLMEGLIIVGAATLTAGGLAYFGSRTMVAHMPPAIVASSVNPIDIDYRAALFMVVVSGLVWVIVSLPVVAFAGRANLLELLKIEGLSVTASRLGVRVRQMLTVAQIALAVLLLAGSVLYVRTYLVLLRLDKGFDSSGVVAISLTIPPQSLGTPAERHVLAQTILERLRARPGVMAAFEGSPPPSTGDSPTALRDIEVDDRPPMESNLRFPKLHVEPDYFTVLRIPLLGGRMFAPGEPPANVIITEALAARLWPNGNAVGRRFREDRFRPWYHVIGIVGHVRTLQDSPTGPEQYFQLYFARQPPPPPPPASAARPAAPSAGLMYGFLTVTARVDSRSRAGDLYQTVRAVDPRNILKLDFADDQYARQFADRLAATSIVSAFGLLAFLVAGAGIYGLMAFLVASREREIGIRLALGADGTAIHRLVLGSSLRLVLVGAATGVAAASMAARWVESQLFGVQPTDPLTFAGVVAAIVSVALFASWHPARQAAQVDPTVLLKS